MKFIINKGFLQIYSCIHFEDLNYLFCGRPYVCLVAHKEPFLHWKEYSIGISIHDHDDFDAGLIYETNKEQFDMVLHELINWIIDHEKGYSNKYLLFDNLFEFFPDCRCRRYIW